MYQKIHISQSLGNNVIIAKHNCLKLSYISNEISHSVGYWGIALTSLIQLVQSEKLSHKVVNNVKYKPNLYNPSSFNNEWRDV